jgi:hypothetical protein
MVKRCLREISFSLPVFPIISSRGISDYPQQEIVLKSAAEKGFLSKEWVLHGGMRTQVATLCVTRRFTTLLHER